MQIFLGVFLLAYILFPDKLSDLLKAASNAKLPQNNRSSFIMKNGMEIFLDAYNANPSSMEVSLKAYRENAMKKNYDFNSITIIVGDMNELGELAELEHENLGRLIKKLGFSNVIFVGNYKSAFNKGFATKNSFTSLGELVDLLPILLKDTNYLFIKASRSLQLEQLLDIV